MGVKARVKMLQHLVGRARRHLRHGCPLPHVALRCIHISVVETSDVAPTFTTPTRFSALPGSRRRGTDGERGDFDEGPCGTNPPRSRTERIEQARQSRRIPDRSASPSTCLDAAHLGDIAGQLVKFLRVEIADIDEARCFHRCVEDRPSNDEGIAESVLDTARPQYLAHH